MFYSQQLYCLVLACLDREAVCIQQIYFLGVVKLEKKTDKMIQKCTKKIWGNPAKYLSD